MTATGALGRPRVTRETRRLLAAGALALLALWVLARVRFPDAPPATNPVPPLLAQLAPPARFSELAAEINAAGERIRGALVVVPLQADDGMKPRVAVRIGAGVAAAVAPLASAASLAVTAQALATDRPSGLMLVSTNVPEGERPRPAVLRSETMSLYVIAATALPQGQIEVRPVYVSLWPGPVAPAWKSSAWDLSTDAGVTPGTFLFTPAAELIGVAVRTAERLAVVPATAFYAAADSLIGATDAPGTGWIGVEVATLTSSLAAATGASAGVLVVHVDESIATSEHVRTGDVIVTINDVAVRNSAEWATVAGRLRVGEEVRLRLQRDGRLQDVRVVANALPAPAAAGFGARLERVAGRTRVAAIERGSSAEAAGLTQGDVITRVGTIDDPTPAQMLRAFDGTRETPLLVLFSRGDRHHATTVTR